MLSAAATVKSPPYIFGGQTTSSNVNWLQTLLSSQKSFTRWLYETHIPRLKSVSTSDPFQVTACYIRSLDVKNAAVVHVVVVVNSDSCPSSIILTRLINDGDMTSCAHEELNNPLNEYFPIISLHTIIFCSTCQVHCIIINIISFLQCRTYIFIKVRIE